MLNGQEVFRSLEITDDIQTAKLGILDQLRLIAANFSNNDVAELDTNEKLAGDKLKKVASLSRFIDRTTERMQELKQNSATVKLSSEYLPYIDEVFNDKDGYGRYYDFRVIKKDIPINVRHTFIVKISKK